MNDEIGNQSHNPLSDSDEEINKIVEPNPCELEAMKKILEDMLHLLREITSQKYKIIVTFVFPNNSILETIALFNTGVDLDCINPKLVP